MNDKRRSALRMAQSISINRRAGFYASISHMAVTGTVETCRYPIGEPGEPGFHFCGIKPVVPGYSYCKMHKRLCYHAVPPATGRPFVLSGNGSRLAVKAS